MCACARAQVRLPLSAIPEVLAKLSSAHPLSWADLAAAYASPEAAAAAKSPAEDMMGYLTAHGIPAKLNEAVNKLAAEKPADPLAFLIAQLSS